ncbi:hypothetical protein CHKEEEPN_2674 [Methylorubrum podarium]|nr:hypothetical protein CHKEEEPN_2674 [Methylorubrum podarium]
MPELTMSMESDPFGLGVGLRVGWGKTSDQRSGVAGTAT